MELKKSKDANNETVRGPLVMIGLLFVASIVLASFTYTTESDARVVAENDNTSSDDVLQANEQEQPKEETPPPAVDVPPPPQEEIIIEENKEEPIVAAPPVPPPVIIAKPTEVKEDEIIDFPDVEASFPGGAAALKQYIRDNTVYPEMAMEMNDQGKVYLSFVVEKDGRITHIKVERGVTQDLDREAKRVVRSMPSWKPGEAKGKSVRTKCSLPIVFTLQ